MNRVNRVALRNTRGPAFAFRCTDTVTTGTLRCPNTNSRFEGEIQYEYQLIYLTRGEVLVEGLGFTCSALRLAQFARGVATSDTE